jgi:hypothetical protein
MGYGNSAIIKWSESPRFSTGWFSLGPSKPRRASSAASQPAPSFILRAQKARLRSVPSAAINPENDTRESSIVSKSVVQLLLDGGRGMVARLCEVGGFVRRLRTQLRFGELSRAPLQLLRLEVQAGSAECEWIARPADHWDTELQSGLAERNASAQAITDAIQIRELLFLALPNLRSALVRVYRHSANEKPELIIEGTVTREQRVSTSIRSLAMRAKLFGLHFRLTDGVLETLPSEHRAPSGGPYPVRVPQDRFEDRAAVEGGRRPLF